MGHDTDIIVTPVHDRRGKRDFIRLPKKMYRSDPHWIAPLELEQSIRVFGKNPFFEHAQCQAWTATRNGKVVGRITAQIDELYPQQHDGHKLGYFGMLEGEDDAAVFSTLLATAEDWLRQRGMTEIQGPFNLSINEEVGLLVEGFEAPPFVMMGHALPHYANRIEEQGYQKTKDLLTYTIHPDFVTPKVMQKLVDTTGNVVTVRCLRRKQLAEEFEIMRDIFNDAWSNNWGFVPFTEAEFSDMAKTLTFLLDDDYVQIAEIDGRPVAFIVALPNINEAAKDLQGRLLPFGWLKLIWRLKVRYPLTARVPLMGVRKEYQHARLGPTLAFMVIDAVRTALVKRGIENVEMGWILENNDGMRNIIESIGGKQYKKYRVYQKQL